MAQISRQMEDKLYLAATYSFNVYNPAEALQGLLHLASNLLEVEKVALYEFDASDSTFSPRFVLGVNINDLGRVSSSGDHPIINKALSSKHSVSSNGQEGSLGLPLAPGTIACAPCLSGGQTIGLLFISKDPQEKFENEDLITLEVLATRAAEVLAFARQSATQGYLLHKLSLLYQASHDITGSDDRDDAIRQIAAHMLNATSADLCEIMLTDEPEEPTRRYKQKLDKAMKASVSSEIREKFPEYDIHVQILETQKPGTLSIKPPSGTARDIALLENEEIAAIAIFPLATRNESMGLVRMIYTRPGRQINEQEMELAQAIINIGAIGLEDARHLQTAQSRATQLQILSDIGREMTSTLDLEVALENAMRNTQRLLNAEACVLFLLDEEGKKLNLKASGGSRVRIRDVAIRLDEGIAGWVARNQTPLIVNDVRSNPLYHSAIDGQTGLLTTSVLCVPLETRGDTKGVIEAINHPSGTFSESDQQMLSSVASWAAIALDNANLFERVAEERSRLEATMVDTADAVVLTDRSGQIILVNKAASQAFRINPELAIDRPAGEIFFNHPLGEVLTSPDIELPTTIEITTPTERVLYSTISEIPGVGRVAVMQDITALKQIDRMRSQLLGTAAHDLKNPLNAIRLGADLLHDAPLTEQQRKALNMMHRATDNMTSLITGLLETIRVESTANLVEEPCQINDLVRRAIEDLRPLAEARQHKINYKPPSESLLIMGDPSRLNSVMSNLLSNAIKFTGPKGIIFVAVDWDDEEIIISVKDNGPGIPEDEIPRVFEHLFRGRVTVQDPNNPIEGTGLGLALAKTVIEQHGGRIWVESKEEEGSTFSFALPREPTPKTGSLRTEE